jgi:hypothetical protein
VIRYQNNDVMNNLGGVLDDLHERMSPVPIVPALEDSTSPCPSLPRRGKQAES